MTDSTDPSEGEGGAPHPGQKANKVERLRGLRGYMRRSRERYRRDIGSKAFTVVNRGMLARLNDRLPDLANVLFGVALTLAVATPKDLISALQSAPDNRARVFDIALLLVRIVLGVLMWTYFFRVTHLVRFKNEKGFIGSVLPLVFAAVYWVAAAAVPLNGKVSDIVKNPFDYDWAFGIASFMFAAFFFNLGLLGWWYRWVASTSKDLRNEIRATDVACFSLSLASVSMLLMTLIGAEMQAFPSGWLKLWMLNGVVVISVLLIPLFLLSIASTILGPVFIRAGYDNFEGPGRMVALGRALQNVKNGILRVSEPSSK